MDGDWLIAGDFNEIKDASEKKGGAALDMRAYNNFVNWINKCGLIDLGFIGSRFTWKAIGELKKDLLKWNKKIFGNIFKAKKRLLNRIAGIQRSNTYGVNPYLDKLEQELNKKLNDILDKEETFWMQKSRQEWIVEGDRNTRYYHTKTIIRRGKNRIQKLRNKEGNWIEEEEELKAHVLKHFQDLYQEQVNIIPIDNLSVLMPNFSTSDCRKLIAMPTKMEIRRAIFSIGSLKVPGSDGLPSLIYKNNWEIMKGKLCNFIYSCWTEPKQIEQSNTTLLMLVPKLNNPEFISQFRLIALCNVCYKVITKILVDRIKPHLNDKIAAHQSSFVPGRKIQDNIVIAKEMMHTMRRMKGKNVIWNGNKMEEFVPKRGLKQGDPISPYLFVIGMDKLSHLIEDWVQKGLWKAIRVGREGPDISHLMFTDDLLLFAEATIDQIKEVTGVIETFCKAYGLKINQNWLENKGILINKALNLDTVDAESLVWEWTKQNGKWDIDKFNQNLPPEIVMEIICKPPPQAENDDDRRGWRPSHDGNFSINSTYKELRKWPSEEKTQLGKYEELDWRDVFITACWRIWQLRNKEIHEQQYRRPIQPYAKINKEAKKIKRALEKDYLIEQRRGRIEMSIRWNPPPAGWIKLNSDEITQGNPGTIGCGGILRNKERRWTAGFSHKIGVGTAFMAELCGVKKGLEIIWTMSFRKIMVEIDAGAVIKLLNKGESLASHPNAVVREIYELKRRNWNIHFVQIYREGNMCADYLAKKSLTMEADFIFWDIPPSDLRRIISDDERWVTLPRLVCT
ncbi:uncharacterized protein [Arachis hypogaea]|uniref:uncharacterized protein n=1 Tax=Arachis hypogaea TaxID=3818 RepID=UPI003B224744